MLRVLLFLAVSGALAAQDLASIHLSKEHAQSLKAIYDRKVAAEREWERAERWFFSHYVAQPGVAVAGGVELKVESIPGPWQWGMRFTPDFEVATPKPEPKPEACPQPEVTIGNYGLSNSPM